MGSKSSGGTLSPALRRLGGTWLAEEILPQGKDGSLRRVTKDAGRRRAFARAKRARRLECPGVTVEPRRASCPCRLLRGDPRLAVRQDLSPWARPDASAGPAGRGTHRAAIDDTPPRSPRASSQLSTTTEKNKNFAFFGRFGGLRLAGRPGGGPGGPSPAARRPSIARALIAQ